MKRFYEKLWAFTSSWTGTILIVLLLIFFVMQAFTIPTRSMVSTLYEGDFLFVKKFSYGIPTPRIPWLEINILPDFFNNGHLIEGERPQRGDIVVFNPPTLIAQKTYFVKRTFAVGGDEIIFTKDGLYLHPHEGDEYVRKEFSGYILKEFMGKLFVKEPLSGRYPGIHYQSRYYKSGDIGTTYLADEQGKLYYRVCIEGDNGVNIGDGELECELWRKEYTNDPLSVFTEDKNIGYTNLANDLRYIKLRIATNSMQEIEPGIFYKQVEPDHFFMIGDNRNNSLDSRFWGSVPYRDIIGKPWFIYFSVNKANSEESGASEDKKARYTIRWDRIFKSIDSIEERMREAMPK